MLVQERKRLAEAGQSGWAKPAFQLQVRALPVGRAREHARMAKKCMDLTSRTYNPRVHLLRNAQGHPPRTRSDTITPNEKGCAGREPRHR